MKHRHHNPALAGIAVFKLFKALLVAAIGLSALQWINSDLADQAQNLIGALALSSEKRALVHVLETLSGLSEGKLRAIGIIAFVYAALFLTEGIGLWLELRWAEYLTAIATASFLPIEIYELSRKFTAPRSIALIINLLVLGYLIWIIRKGTPKRTPDVIIPDSRVY